MKQFNTQRDGGNKSHVMMEALEDRRLMTAIDQASETLAFNVAASSRHAQHAVPVERSTAASPMRIPLKPSRALPSDVAEATLRFNNVPDAEFPSNGINVDIVTGTYTPRIKLWGAERIGKAEAMHPQPKVSDGIGTRPPIVRRTEPTPAPRRALLVEPDEPSRLALSSILRNRGWQVTAVADCVEAESHLNESPDVVIVDLDRRETHGEALLQHIREAGTATRVAVITADPMDARLPALVRLHPDALLSKPLNVAAFLRSLSPSAEPDVPPTWN